MSNLENGRGVIRSNAVRRVAEPVLVHCAGSVEENGGTITVVPLMQADRVAGLQIRCRCGGSVLIECVYEEEQA